MQWDFFYILGVIAVNENAALHKQSKELQLLSNDPYVVHTAKLELSMCSATQERKLPPLRIDALNSMFV